MQPRTAIIILIIVAIIVLGGMYFLYKYSLVRQQADISAKHQSEQKELTPEEKVVESLKIMREREQQDPELLKKQQMVIDALKTKKE